MKQKHFWLAMQYMCTNGHHERTVYLEDGLEEGPPNQMPVPMFMGICVDCKAPIGHVKWDLDHDVDIMLDKLEKDAPYFAYPNKRERKRLHIQACGVPTNRPSEWLGKK